jgi:uncharacterized protein YndB with AHSA1/START domain
MLTQAPTLTFTRTVAATPAEVYRAFTTPTALRDWLCDAAQIDPRLGGRVYCWWNQGYYTAGVITGLTRDEHLAFTWQGPGEPPGAVRAVFAATDGGAVVTVTYDGDDAPAGQAPVARIWEAALENLQSILEDGVDLRVARRPMFGLSNGDELNATRAAQLGVPVTEGIWIGGLVEGLAGANAGLQRDDVVVRLDDHPITTFASFLAVLQGHQAGDCLPVTFYRGAAQHTATLELSRRPPPDVPADGAALAAAARAAYDTCEAELAACLAGLSEADADYRPGPEEWNAKEILAHLIAVEIDTHAWIIGVLEDNPSDQPFHNNFPQRMRAIAAASPTVADLAAEIRRQGAVNRGMLESLPPEVGRRRHVLAPLTLWINGMADHNREHFAEIRALVEAAQKAGSAGA